MIKETKHERFKRIAGKRTNDVLDKMRLLGNCSNKNTYEYSKEEVNKMDKCIINACDKVLAFTYSIDKNNITL